MKDLITFGIYFLDILYFLFQFCMFAWILLSWFSASKNDLGIMLDSIIRPIIKPFSWARIGMISLAPIIAFYLIAFLHKILKQALIDLL